MHFGVYSVVLSREDFLFWAKYLPLDAPLHALAAVTLHRKSTSSSPFFMSDRSRSSPSREQERAAKEDAKAPERERESFTSFSKTTCKVLRCYVSHPYLFPQLRQHRYRDYRERQRSAMEDGIPIKGKADVNYSIVLA